MLTFSGVASNFAGVPLAFAFIATLGRLGPVTVLAARVVRHQHLRDGLQPSRLLGSDAHLPLLPDPADDPDHHARARRAEARMARGGIEILGASGFPVLAHGGASDPLPSLLGTFALLFANSFGAVATALRCTGSSLTSCRSCCSPDPGRRAGQDPHLGYALAFGMIVVTGVANALYIWLRARSERWIK
jgi:putative spermidine/putrescine transport system permease protein